MRWRVAPSIRGRGADVTSAARPSLRGDLMGGLFMLQPTEAGYARFENRMRLDVLVPRYTIAPG
jgi:hypothetical protein